MRDSKNRKIFYKNKVPVFPGILLICIAVVLLLIGYGTRSSLSKSQSIQVNIVLPPCRQPAVYLAPVPQDMKKRSEMYDASYGVTKPPDDYVSRTFTYKDITVKMTGSHVLSSQNITQLKKFIDEVPQIYLNYRPWNIYTVIPQDLSDPVEQDHAKTVSAFTSGPTMYLMPSAFQGDYQGFRYLLYHEWMHLIQYYKVYEEIPEVKLRQFAGVQIYQMGEYTPFFLHYAVNVGWINPASPQRVLKVDPESQKQSDYGKKHPVEDQAETAGYYLAGQQFRLSQNRTDWIEQFLGCK